MQAFVVDNAPLDQNGLFPVEFLVWLPGLDKLCGVRPPVAVSKYERLNFLEVFWIELTNRI